MMTGTDAKPDEIFMEISKHTELGSLLKALQYLEMKMFLCGQPTIVAATRFTQMLVEEVRRDQNLFEQEKSLADLRRTFDRLTDELKNSGWD